MNTMRESHTDKAKKLIDLLGLSPNNHALALEYLTAETCDDGLLKKAEPQDFSGLGWKELNDAVSHLAEIRASGDDVLVSRSHAVEKDDLSLTAAVCRAVRYIQLCREKLQEEQIIQRWQSMN